MSSKPRSTASSKKSKRFPNNADRQRKSSRSGGGKKKGRSARELSGPELPGSDQWSEWVQHLTSRSKPADFLELLQHARTHPLKWALPDEYEDLPTPKLLKQLTRLHRGKRFASSQVVTLLRQWLDEVPNRKPDSLIALECLGWAHALPRLGPMLTELEWRGLLSQLDETIEAAGGINLVEQPVAHQLLNGELPLTLAYLLPEISRYENLRGSAKAALSFAAKELMDGEGLVSARHQGSARELLACWTRCSLLASSAPWSCFDEDGQNQYEWAVRQAMRTSRSDGSLVFSKGLSGDWCSDLLRNALELGGDASDAKIAAVMLPGARGKFTDRQIRKLPEPSLYSEWSELCVMRSKWSRKSPQFSCLFANRELKTELTIGGRLIWSGATSPALNINGHEAAIKSDWTELCWFTDEDVDYLELEADFEGGWRIQRQMLLTRRDDFLLLSDAVLGPEDAEIQYDLRLPLADDLVFLPEETTREGYLKNTRPLCTVLPISLPEWRSAPARGSLGLAGSDLVLDLSATSRRLYAPLFIDLSSRRWVEKRTWRQLTVAERLEIQPHGVAAGYRIQLGRKQWMIYRSLAPCSNRTLLGQNLSQEFVVARFDSDGCLAELIEIE